MTVPPELPPALQARLWERSAWLAGAAWVAVAAVLYLIHDWLMGARSELVRTLAHAVFGIGGIFWVFAWAPMREWIHTRLWTHAEAHMRRFGRWPD